MEEEASHSRTMELTFENFYVEQEGQDGQEQGHVRQGILRRGGGPQEEEDCVPREGEGGGEGEGEGGGEGKGEGGQARGLEGEGGPASYATGGQA